MHIIKISQLRKDTEVYSDVKKQVESWYAVVRKANWENLEQLKLTYKDAEAVGNFTVFNIKGNRYRLIVGIDYQSQTMYYKYFLTHAEYDKNKWKKDKYF